MAVSPEFVSCLRATELEKGQMLHADSFNLGDSMSALELMDPKMDAGVVNDKNRSVIAAGKPTTFMGALVSVYGMGGGRGFLITSRALDNLRMHVIEASERLPRIHPDVIEAPQRLHHIH